MLALLLCLSLPHSSASPNPNFLNALWIAESNGVLKITTATGTVLLEITNAKDVRAIALDEQREAGLTLSAGTDTEP